MNKVNPKYVLRNYMAQLAIDAADKGDYSVVNELFNLLLKPYDKQPESQKWFAKRPDWAKVKSRLFDAFVQFVKYRRMKPKLHPLIFNSSNPSRSFRLIYSFNRFLSVDSLCPFKLHLFACYFLFQAVIMQRKIACFKVADESFDHCSSVLDVAAVVIKMVFGDDVKFAPKLFDHFVLPPIVVMPR